MLTSPMIFCDEAFDEIFPLCPNHVSHEEIKILHNNVGTKKISIFLLVCRHTHLTFNSIFVLFEICENLK